jgi:chromosomal replication initiator protein
MPSEPQLEQIWVAFHKRLRDEIPDDVYRVWLGSLRAVALSNDTLYVQAPQETREWIRRRFGRALSKTLESVDKSLRHVEIVSESDRENGPEPDQSAHHRTLNPTHRFDDFVIGAGNRFAHAAALATAELPSQAYNPLFLCGPTGVGKTHLLGAIGNYTILNDAGLEVVHTTGEIFTGEFTLAVRSGGMEAFKAKHRNADVLLLDDVQFVESKPRTAEELLHTFDVLIGRGAQIVLGADRMPSALPALDSRLRERFESGLVVELGQPDFETRLSIIRKRAGRIFTNGDQLAALELLARQIPSSIHALEGALTRVRAYASLTQQPLTTALVEHVLSTLYSPSSRSATKPGGLSIEQIQSSTSSLMDLPTADLVSAKRSRQVVYARQVAMYLCRELTDLSLPAIGERFGGRDHTTVLHAHRQVRTRIIADRSTRELVDKIRSQLGAPTLES